MAPVLNAFRHHRNSHRCGRAPNDGYWRCSTPFGIIGILTHSERVLWPQDACAQRLSASSEFSRRKLSSHANEFDVLNAFRHHRNSHVLGQNTERVALFVLNAFRHHRNSHGLAHKGRQSFIDGAQRLSASSEFSRARGQLAHIKFERAQRLSASSEFSLNNSRQ